MSCSVNYSPQFKSVCQFHCEIPTFSPHQHQATQKKLEDKENTESDTFKLVQSSSSSAILVSTLACLRELNEQSSNDRLIQHTNLHQIQALINRTFQGMRF